MVLFYMAALQYSREICLNEIFKNSRYSISSSRTSSVVYELYVIYKLYEFNSITCSASHNEIHRAGKSCV